MQIKNTGDRERRLSRDGVDIPLMPGASVDIALTDDEAAAYRAAGFTVTGTPVKADKKVKPE